MKQDVGERHLGQVLEQSPHQKKEGAKLNTILKIENIVDRRSLEGELDCSTEAVLLKGQCKLYLL